MLDDILVHAGLHAGRNRCHAEQDVRHVAGTSKIWLLSVCVIDPGIKLHGILLKQ